MGQGPNITPEITKLLEQIFLKNTSSGPTKVRKELLNKMKEKGLDKIFGPNYPSVSTVSVYLKKFKKNYEARPPESKRLDEPWSLGSLVEYPIALEDIPLVVSIYEKCLLEEHYLAIREALWIGRLHKIVEMYHSKHVLPLSDPQAEALRLKLGHRPEGYQQIKLEDLVLEWAYQYSQYERVSELEGEPFDSGELDGYMMVDVYDFYGERRADAIYSLEEQYDADLDEFLFHNNLSVGNIERVAASFGRRGFRIFAVPQAEIDKICSDEGQDFKPLHLGMRDDLMLIALGEDASDKVLSKLMGYQTFYSKGGN